MTLGYVFIYIIYTSLSYFWLIEKQISFSIWCIHINDIIYYAVSVFFFCLHPVPSTPSFFAFESGHSLFWYTFCALLFIYNILSTLKKKWWPHTTVFVWFCTLMLTATFVTVLTGLWSRWWWHAESSHWGITP